MPTLQAAAAISNAFRLGGASLSQAGYLARAIRVSGRSGRLSRSSAAPVLLCSSPEAPRAQRARPYRIVLPVVQILGGDAVDDAKRLPAQVGSDRRAVAVDRRVP